MPESASFAAIKSAVAEALEADSATAEPILRRHLGDDDTALAEARRWLAASREATDMFERATPEDALLPFQSAGPYSVVRRLGSGGMGVVYEVERDGQRYALKSIRPSMAADWSLARFRMEAEILGRLDHPSIARLIDTGTVNDLPYFVMELVDGEPVDRYVEQRSLSLDERLRLFEQVCRSVGFAHEKGFAHRDLKPGNIWVTGDGKPKLLDFGIAKAIHGNTTLAVQDQTQTAQRMVTPAYASPEHLRGEPTGSASDVYSLGVILFEIASGRRLTGAIGAVPTVGSGEQKLDWIVRKSLAPDPAKRYESATALADDVARLLAGEKIEARGESFPKRWGSVIRRRPALVGAIAVIATSILAWAGWTRLAPHAGAKARPSVAIAGFVTSGAEAAWVPESLGDALELELGATGKLRVIRGTDVDRVRAAYHEQLTRGRIPQGLIDQIPADYYVTGQVQSAAGGPARLLLQFVRRSSSEAAYTETLTLSRNQIPMTAYTASRGFQRQLGLLTEADVRGTQPIPYLGNPRVVELYTRALEELRDYHYLAARDAIDAAVKIDPENPVVHLARARILSNIGARIEARQDSERALKNAGQLPEEQRFVIEALDHQLHGRWDKAEGVLRHLAEIFYDDPRYAADLAHNIGIEGRHPEALASIERFRKTLPPDAVPFWFYLVAIEEAKESSDFARAAEYIAMVKQRVRRASVQFGQVLRLEARMRYAQQKPLEALALYAQAVPMAEQASDLYTLSSCWNEMGIIHYDLGHNQKAEEYYQRALVLAKKTGTRLVEGNLLNNLGLLVQERGALAEAEQIFRSALRAWADVGASPGYSLCNLGNTQLLRGDFAHARGTLTAALDEGRKAGDANRIGWALFYQARLAYETNDDQNWIGIAKQGWSEVKDQGPAVAIVAGRLGRELAAAYRKTGDLKGAKAAFDETLAMLEKANAASLIAPTLIARGPLLAQLGEFGLADQDLARIPKLSAPGLDPDVDRELAALKAAAVWEQRYDAQELRRALPQLVSQMTEGDKCWFGDRVFRLAIRHGDRTSAEQASRLCSVTLARSHSERERTYYNARAAMVERRIPAFQAALTAMRKKGSAVEANELESYARTVEAGNR